METSIRRVPVSRAAAALRWKKNSGIYERIEALLRDEVAGDPMGGTRWTRKTTQSIARELTVWRCDLQQKLCNRYGLEVTVCHYPPGASKWNPIEHRMFSEISKQWQGVPLESYETVLKYIRRTKTKTGLSVAALLNSKNYPKGETATEKELDLLNIRRLTPHPEWNYTIKPQNQKQLQKM